MIDKWVGCHAQNFNVGRRNNMKPDAIVVHVMAGTLVGTDAFFNQSPTQRTQAAREQFLARTKRTPADLAAAQRIVVGASSAHYGIGQPWKQPGKIAIHQYVKDEDTSYHAGVVSNPTWKLFRPGINPNWHTIGIEHEGTADSAWSDLMYQTSAKLIRHLCDKWDIPMDREHIIGHREIYAVKPCPGRCDLDRLVQMAKEIK